MMMKLVATPGEQVGNERFGGIFGGMMQLTTTQYLLKSAGYAICSIACLTIHLFDCLQWLVTRREGLLKSQRSGL